MDVRHTILAGALLLVACGGGSSAPAPGDTLVYMDRGARQCESDGTSLEASAQILISAGIDVLQSNCGIRTGVAFPAVCGAGTADILVHEIRSVNLPDAEQLGFQEIGTLIDPAAGTGYELVDCDSRLGSDL